MVFWVRGTVRRERVGLPGGREEAKESVGLGPVQLCVRVQGQPEDVVGSQLPSGHPNPHSKILSISEHASLCSVCVCTGYTQLGSTDVTASLRSVCVFVFLSLLLYFDTVLLCSCV